MRAKLGQIALKEVFIHSFHISAVLLLLLPLLLPRVARILYPVVLLGSLERAQPNGRLDVQHALTIVCKKNSTFVSAFPDRFALKKGTKKMPFAHQARKLVAPQPCSKTR